MPTTDSIREAIGRKDADAAEALIEEVAAKREGKGLSGHDRQIFERLIADIRRHALPVEPSTPEPAPRPKRAPRNSAQRFEANPDTGDLEAV